MHRASLQTRLQDEEPFQNVILRTYEDDDPYAWSVVAVIDDMGFLAVDEAETGEYRVTLDTARYDHTSVGSEAETLESVERYLDWIEEED